MKLLLKVDGMSCEHCVKAVHEALIKLEGVKQVKVDLKVKLVEVEYNKELTNKLLIMECIEEQGFDVEL